ncbi:peptidase family C50-domain-containing protein [Fennellomyces sp. T-0311]|nr:peptidase family C50-domain-containing protein [Fennellomyces sp. T-0311]
MTLTPAVLLSSLKDYSQCTDELVAMVRSTVLEPFQPDLSRIQAGHRVVKPTRAEFKAMTTKLAPLSMRIINQCIESLRDIKARDRKESPVNREPIKCLIDAASSAIAALKHMSANTTLKPLDIEKTMSNLICKIVDLGEYTRALDELTKLRTNLANTVNITIENMRSPTSTVPDTTLVKSKDTNERLASPRRGFLTESPNRISEFHSPVAARTFATELAPSNSPWEDTMLQKYGDLFSLPLDKSINDTTTILLVLAYQMNVIRCWTDMADGALLRHMPQLLDRPGNFMDWCTHLATLDLALAQKQFGALYRQLSKAACKFPFSDVGRAKAFVVQAMAMVALKHTGTVPLQSLCKRMVQMSVSYERSEGQIDYRSIQKHCAEILEDLNPNVGDIAELDSYFVMCEYYAYTSRKAKSYSGAYYAYKHMIRPLRSLVSEPKDCSYYHAAYAATAKLSFGSVQLDKLVSGNTYTDVTTTLTEINRCLHAVFAASEDYKQSNDYTDQALNSLVKAIDMFRQSCGRYHEYVERRAKRKQTSNCSTPTSTPLSSRSSLKSDDDAWNACIPAIVSALQHASEVLPSVLQIMKKKSWRGKSKQLASPNEVMSALVEIMVLLSRMQFDIDDPDSYQNAYEHLSTAEEMCSEIGFSNGYRWLSTAFYRIGVSMYNDEMYSDAIYPLRKACALLEKDGARAMSDAGRLQLCKRYDVLGSCCQKDKRFEESTKAYKLALKRLPCSSIEAFVKEADSVAIYTLMTRHPLIPRLVERFLRATITDENDIELLFASNIMDLSQVEPSKKTIIYECELRAMYMLSTTMDCTRHQGTIIHTLLKHYTPELFPIRRARVLLDKVRFELGKNKSRSTAMKAALNYASEAGKLLKSETFGNDSNLLQYRRHYLALASSWAGICSAELDKAAPEYFAAAFHHWGALLKDVGSIYKGKITENDIKAVHSQIDDVDKLYDHFRMLTDFFAVKQQPVHHISTLRLMLKLNNGLRRTSEDQVSASIIITANIGRVYSELGYSGKAAVEFSMAKQTIMKRPCSNESELTYILLYSAHLAKIGNLEKGKNTFNTSGIVWESYCQGDSANTLRSERRQMARRLMIADAHYTRASLSSQTESSVDQSIEDCTTALRILNYCSRSVKQELAAKTNTSSPLADPFADTPPEPRKDESAVASSIAFKESEWTIAQKICTCLQYLIELHLLRGSWRDAQYYLEKGNELGEKLHSQSMKFKFLVANSDFHLRCGSVDASATELKSAKEIQPEGEIYIREDAELNMAAGNVDAHQGCLSDAIKSYDVAHEAFEKIVDPGYIATIEDLVERNEDIVKLRTLVRESDSRDAVHYECSPLLNLQGMNSIHKAMVLAHEKSISEALSVLVKLESSSTMTKNMPELQVAIAQLRSMMVALEFNDRKGNKLPDGEVQMLPSFKMNHARSIVKKSTMSHELRVVRDNLNSALERMLETHAANASKSRIQLVRDMCLHAGYLMFLKNFFSSDGRKLVNNYSTVSAYYLEMSKGLTIRREMQRCLKAKLEALSGVRPGSNVQWPDKIEDRDDDPMDTSPIEALHGKPQPWLHEHLKTLSNAYNEEHYLDNEEFQEKFVDIIPSHWTVCSLTMNPTTNELYVVRLQSGSTPIVVKLPLQRTRRPERQNMNFCTAVQELQQIISGSDDTIKNAKSYTQKGAANEWWKKRIQLDQQLKQLLSTIENEWLGGFKGLLAGNYQEDADGLNKFQEKVSQAVYRIIPGTRDKTQSWINISLDMCRVFLRLGPDPSGRDLDDIIYFMLSCYETHDVVVDYFNIDISELKIQLRSAITRYHQTASLKHIDTMKRQPNSHVILIPDNHLHPFPWESIPILRVQSVSRLPCLSFLRDRILANQAAASDGEWSVDSRKTCYVLNPSGDLMHTQNEFESVFKRMASWQGHIQERPAEFHWQNVLESRELYMYFGHSAGQSIIRGQNIKKLKHCPVALLMGCSSGTLTDKGEYDLDGYIMNFLLGGSPAVVANLWDVTDKSIDSLTQAMLSSWGVLKDNGRASLVEAVASSRSSCNLPYLIGAAPVVYGVPVYIKRQ